MSETEVTINIQCPVEGCKKEKEISIPQYLFENKRMHMLKIPIHSGMCCEHEFIAFVSTKAHAVRGYEKIDTAVDLSQIERSSQTERLLVPDLLSKYGSLGTASIILALLQKKPMIILRTKYEKNLSAKLVNLLMRILPEDYHGDFISLKHILDSDFKKTKIKDSLVISPTGVIANTPWQSLNDRYIREIINKSLDILDSESQCTLIQNELGQILSQASLVVDIIENSEIFEEELIKKLNQIFNIKITNAYLKMLKLIVSERFKKNTKRIKIRSFSKLKEGLW